MLKAKLYVYILKKMIWGILPSSIVSTSRCFCCQGEPGEGGGGEGLFIDYHLLWILVPRVIVLPSPTICMRAPESSGPHLGDGGSENSNYSQQE
jgi:hypothetical protein